MSAYVLFLSRRSESDRTTRYNRTHLQRTWPTHKLSIAYRSCRQPTHKRPACLTNTTNMIGGRRTFQTHIAATKHDNLLFVDSIVCSARREMTMTTDQLHSSSSCTQKVKPSSLQHEEHQTSNIKHHTDLAQHNCNSSRGASKSHKQVIIRY